MRKIVTLMSLAWITFLVPKAFAQFTQNLDDTCQSYIKSVEDADETMDQTRQQSSIDIAESRYVALNKVVVEVGLAALPLPQDAKTRARRSMAVASKCRKDMSSLYHNAVADAYLLLREAAGLPTDLPARAYRQTVPDDLGLR